MNTDFPLAVPLSSAHPSASSPMLWAGRILSGLVTLFMFFDAATKIMKAAPAVEGTTRLGYPESLVVPIGAALLVCVVVYLIPRTSMFGAILLTGYLGGATATRVRMESPWFLFPGGFAVLIWAGLYLRDERLCTLVPLRK